MFSSGHFFSGLLLAQLLQQFFPITFSEVLLIGIASMLIPDLDYLLYGRRHRFSPFHTLLTPITFALFGFLDPLFAYFSLASLLHLLLDTVDAGIMWCYPFNRKLYGFFLAESTPKPFFEYLNDYIRCKHMLFLEMFFFVASLLLFFYP